MGLITKKDVIRNMAELEGNDEEEAPDEPEFRGGFDAQESGLLDDDVDRRSGDSR
jgi:hypothetical protein